MICEILLPIPVNKTFYYRTVEFLKPGTLVSVEFKNKKLLGIVIKTFKEKTFSRPLKEINKIFNQFTLTEEILKSTEFISNYTCNLKSLILKMFLTGFEKDNNLKIEQKTNFKNKSLNLSDEQKKTINLLIGLGDKFNVSLLHGVTGSGKTRVYMHVVKEKLSKGFQCLILVPEIILTSEWVKEIEKDFEITPVIYHSSIEKKKREQIFQSIFRNSIRLVIGTRSALSLPFINLGLIVIDEEHDNSYKQTTKLILNFRDFGVVRAKNSNCNIILSSATPSIETFLNTKTKKYKIFKLLKRINENDLPNISIIDSRKEKNLISTKLENEIRKNISRNLQTLLFLNKRGYAPFVICKKCGTTKNCNKCSSSLTLHEYAHRNKSYLLCHYCNYREDFKNFCCSCNSKDSLTFPGYGIEKVYEDVKKLFPNIKIALLSSDKVKSKGLNIQINDIIKNKVNIIIGTQIISKGHNFPFLKTVGILNIDALLNDFDFRSNEKAFQQIVQVAGRAGRRSLEGKVFIQTYQPLHPVLKFSVENDYQGFFNWEIKNRKENKLPPFTNFISIINSSRNEQKVKNI